MTQNEFIRVQIGAIEYFSNTETGESGMSQIGLARACGVSHVAVQNLILTLVTKPPSKWLEPFMGKDLTLVTNHSTSDAKTRNVTILKSAFCSAAITHYAFKGKEQAQDFLGNIADIGLESYIQGLTGWLPIALQSSQSERDNLDRILNRPDPWQQFYSKEFCDRAFNWFGSQFYWEYVYCQFTPQEVCKLNALNPPKEGIRPDKIHQYLSLETKARLTPYIRELVALINGASSRQNFIHGYARHFGKNDQLRLF